MVDGSDSITSPDFQTLKSSLVDLMDGLQLAEDQARFGVVLYSSDVAAEIPLSADRRQLKSKILGLRHPRDGTRTDLGTKNFTCLLYGTHFPIIPIYSVPTIVFKTKAVQYSLHYLLARYKITPQDVLPARPSRSSKGWRCHYRRNIQKPQRHCQRERAGPI